MQTLVQVLQEQEAASSEAQLPHILPKLSERGIVPEPGQMMMWVGQPNSGKSMVALFYAITSELPCLYFSADTDQRTTLYRAAAIKTGLTFDEVKSLVGTSGEDIYHDAIREITNKGCMFEFAPQLNIEDLDLECLAYEEVWGCSPKLIILDNLLNVSNDAGDFNGLVEIMGDLHAMARAKDASLWVLHHVNESTSKPEYPASRSSIRGKISQYPEVIVSLAMVPQENIMRVAVVKHRHAQPSPSGEDYETIYVDPERMTFYNSKTDLANAATTREWQ